MGYTAIMTETDRERISGQSDEPDSKRYEAVSRVRSRIKALERDAGILEQHHPDLYEELREAVCDNEVEHPPTCDDCGGKMESKQGSVGSHYVGNYLECTECGRVETS